MPLPRMSRGRRKGRRVTTTALRVGVSDYYPGYAFDVTITAGDTTSRLWYGDRVRAFTVHQHEGRLRVIHEWSMK